MVLRRQLFWWQCKSCNHLPGKSFTLKKTKRVEHDFSNECIIRNHHCNSSKQCLKVVWKFSTTGVTWVHCNKDAESGFHFDLWTLEVDFGVVHCFRFKQLKQILGDYRQHFDVDSIELVETTPGSRCRKSFEEGCHHRVGHIAWAVEDDAMFCQSFGEILCWFSFACTCWAGWCTTEIQLEGTHESHVAFVCKRCDN